MTIGILKIQDSITLILSHRTVKQMWWWWRQSCDVAKEWSETSSYAHCNDFILFIALFDLRYNSYINFTWYGVTTLTSRIRTTNPSDCQGYTSYTLQLAHISYIWIFYYGYIVLHISLHIIYAIAVCLGSLSCRNVHLCFLNKVFALGLRTFQMTAFQY